MTASFSKTCYVYFLRPIGADGPIKVGYSAYPASRLAIYLTWSPQMLEVAAKIAFEGDGCHKRAMRLERQLHQRYAEHHTHHEWFAAHPRLLRDIDLITAGTFQPWRLPEPQRTNIARYAHATDRNRRSARICPTQRVLA